MAETLFGEDEPGRGVSETTDPAAPLAVRMRPRTLDELVGQEHLLAEGSALRSAITSGEPHSAILFGPPGSGKTTLARVIASAAHGAFEEQSAVNAGKAEVKAVIERARERRRASGRPTILFLDEIHRFNKAQQDALLPAVEDGVVTLIGATTENPYFEVNSALISRSQIYELRPLEAAQVRELLDRSLADPERGIADPPAIDDDALELIAGRTDGDARSALGALERAVDAARERGSGVDLALAEDALQRRAVNFDRDGDRHYDYASALIKAMRGSDPDAALYYLAAMLEGGEDARFIVRRIVILASEDIGNADPQALVVATAAGAAVDRIGLPEAQLTLAQAVAYMALAPKSNAATTAISRARAHVREHGAKLPPDHLRDSHYAGAKSLGRGEGYVYPHDLPNAFSDQPLAPPEVQDEKFYEPTERGFEAKLRERVEWLRSHRGG